MKNVCLQESLAGCFKVVVAAVVLGVASVLYGADGVWTNEIGGLWSNGTNWHNEVVASGLDSTADFSSIDMPGGIGVQLDVPAKIGTLIFGDTDPSSGSWWNLYNNGSATNTLTVTNVIVNAMAGTSGAAIYPLIQGSGPLVKSGVGTLAIVGTNSYSGGTFINSGTLQVGNGVGPSSLGPGPVTNNGTLFYTVSRENSISLPSGGNIAGSGNLIAQAGKIQLNGDITLGGSQSYAQVGVAELYFGIELVAPVSTLTASAITMVGDVGKRLADGGALHLDTSAVNGPINLNISLGRNSVWYKPSAFTANAGTGTIFVSGSGINNSGWRNTPVTLQGAVNISANLHSDASVTINATTNSTISGVLSGGLALNKTGPGTLTLASSSTYSGPTTISEGIVRVAPVIWGVSRHFDASALALANGANVTQWNDLSINAAHAGVPPGNSAPTYIVDAGTGTGLGAIDFKKIGGASNPAKTSQALTFTRDNQIRSVFSVFKGASFLLTDAAEYHFHRPGDDNPAEPLFVGYTAPQLRGGSTYVNGAKIDPLAFAMPTNLHNGYNLVEVLSSGAAVQADSFNKDRDAHAGNQSHAEVLTFDTVVSETKRLQIEAYLNKKWFGIGDGPGNVLSPNSAVILSNNSTLDLSEEDFQVFKSLFVTDKSASTVVLDNTKLFLGDASATALNCNFSGNGTLIKQGSGALSLYCINSFTGAIEVRQGVLKLVGTPKENPVPGAARHFDASTMGLAEGTAVAQWSDLSGNGYNAMQPTAEYKPTYRAGALSSWGALHFTKGAKNAHMRFERDSNIRTVFSVFKGSSFLLTDQTVNHFHRPGDVNPAEPLWSSEPNWASDSIKNGSTYVNGLLVNGMSYAMPTNQNNGFNLIEVLTTAPVQADSINHDRGAIHSGDQQHAEIIIYDFKLDETQRLAVEGYLTRKWFEGESNSPIPAGTPLVMSGGTLDSMGSTHAFGALRVSADSIIDLRTTGALIFADSSSQPWSGSLTLTGTLGPQSLRFGTSRDALTREQLASIVLGDADYELDSQGYLIKVRAGTLITIR